MIEMLIGLLMTASERTCLVEAEHPLVIEAQEVAVANDMAGGGHSRMGQLRRVSALHSSSSAAGGYG